MIFARSLAANERNAFGFGYAAESGFLMAKDKSKSADLTPDLLKRRSGRPTTGKAKSGAERIEALRARRKAQGLCVCCGQPLPNSRPSGDQV